MIEFALVVFFCAMTTLFCIDQYRKELRRQKEYAALLKLQDEIYNIVKRKNPND